MTDPFCLSRRALLAGSGAFVAWANMPSFARAAGRDPRLLVVILRGAMDGLSAVPAVGDPHYADHREHLVVAQGTDGAPRPLDGFFALNAAMPRLHALYGRKQALIVHACATPYRDRSHFDGQNVLESGFPIPGGGTDGWLNRAAAAIPRGARVNPVEGLAISTNVPLILRGSAPVLTWTPPQLKQAPSDTAMRLHDLYAHVDPLLATVFEEGVGLDRLLTGVDMDAGDRKNAPGYVRGEGAFLPVAEGAARIVVRDDGPRLAVLDLAGWDTHSGQGAAEGRLPRMLAALDLALARMTEMLAPVWSDTTILVATEFGRTVGENGNDGTDHGTGTAAFLLGGRVRGGRVVADWPGLRQSDLFDNRDLKPTTDLRAVIKGVLRDQFGLSDAAMAERVFPGSIGVKPMDGLIAA